MRLIKRSKKQRQLKVNAENALNSAKAELVSKENARQTASVNVNTAKNSSQRSSEQSEYFE